MNRMWYTILQCTRSECVKAFFFFTVTASTVLGSDPLPSWNEGDSKNRIKGFVAKVIDNKLPTFVPVPERIAVFDNDGTLWPEAPLPFQAVFALDEVKRQVAENPSLQSHEMVQAALSGNTEKLLAGKHHDGLLHLIAMTHSGMTAERFAQRVRDWTTEAKHPRYSKRYIDLAYQPMLELLSFLRENQFKTFIVSGGGADFMRAWTEDVYGIPPEQVIGSHALTKLEWQDSKPVLIKTTDQFFVDDREGKVVGIHQFIGRRPIACFGNSDGDQAMLEYTTIGNPHPSFGLIVHHTDSDREYAYDSQPPSSGKLVTALAVATERGWTVVDMKRDWNRIWKELVMDETSLIGSWIVEDIDGRGVIDNLQTTIEFGSGGTVRGSTGVNRYSGKATIADGKISFGPLAMTRRAGPPALMDQESKFAASMSRIDRFRIDAQGTLFLQSEDGINTLRLTKMTRKE